MDILQDIVPEYYSDDGSEVFVYAPGVTIQTGLETADFVKAVATEIKPDLLLSLMHLPHVILRGFAGRFN